MEKLNKTSFVKESMFGAGLTIAAALAAYFSVIRPWHLRWGATAEEINGSLPGDEVKPDAGVEVTHAITIDAPSREVWRWLVQIGQGRGGFYSYDWLENFFGLQIRNVDEIRPELQSLKAGDFVRSAHKGWLGGRFDDKAGWFVVRLDPGRSLVLRDEIERGSWAFVLHPVDERRTRLVVRVRGDGANSWGRRLLHLSVFEPAHFIMERKMLLTLKERAEASVADESNTFPAARFGLNQD